MIVTTDIGIRHLYVSPGHNYVGHHGRPPGMHPVVERDDVQCVAGRGILGDRFFDSQPGHPGQITFFAGEVYDAICRAFAVADKLPSVFRRNVVTADVDLNALIGHEFEIQSVRFHGVEECRPCHWMNQAFAPGAEEFLRGRGGLRAMILSDGRLRAQCKKW